MKKFLLLFVFIMGVSLGAVTIDSRTVIVKGDLTIDPEEKSIKILKENLDAILGADLKIIDEKDYDGEISAIFVGRTKRAAEAGVPVSSFASEEYIIWAESEVLLLVGGHPRGTLYSIYEFLEKFAGIRYYAFDCKIIPRNSYIKVPEGTRIQKEPFFKGRFIYITYDWKIGPRDDVMRHEWGMWNKQNDNVFLDYENRKYYYFKKYGGFGHSFYLYSKEFPAGGKDEYFSRDESGKVLRAVNAGGPGQICLTNPEVRKLIKAQIREKIEEDCASAKRYNTERNHYYNIGHNDNCSCCHCFTCSEMAKKYGAYSGVLLDFINDIASEFPDEKFMTFAYTFSAEAPGGIKPLKNVIINFALLGTEFVNHKHDTVRPLSHVNNNITRNQLDKWTDGVVSQYIAVWDYNRLYREIVPSPYTDIRAISYNIPFYASKGAFQYLAENEICCEELLAPKSFHDLSSFLIMKLLDDPTMNSDELISEFMRNYYGPASDYMHRYLKYLETRMEEETSPFGLVPIPKRAYLDLDFFRTVCILLDKAENVAYGNPLILSRINQERIPVDFGILVCLDRLQKENNGTPPYSRDEVIARLKKNTEAALFKYYGRLSPDLLDKKRALEKTRIDNYSNPLDVPIQFANDTIYQFSVLDNGRNGSFLVDDPDAVKQKALCIKASEKNLAQRNIVKFQLEDWALGKILLDSKIMKFEQNEKYNFYFAGRSAIPENGALNVKWTDTLSFNIILRQVYSTLDPEREYDIYFSMKFTGPLFVRDSEKENILFIDRIVFVKK